MRVCDAQLSESLHAAKELAGDDGFIAPAGRSPPPVRRLELEAPLARGRLPQCSIAALLSKTTMNRVEVQFQGGFPASERVGVRAAVHERIVSGNEARNRVETSRSARWFLTRARTAHDAKIVTRMIGSISSFGSAGVVLLAAHAVTERHSERTIRVNSPFWSKPPDF